MFPAAQPPARILLEASTESEWVARHLEALGHEVIVADPNSAPMYANRSRRTKTDQRDARTLMDACETGAWRTAYRLSEARRHVRAELALRDALVRTRTRYIALAKALVRRDGLRVPTSASAWVPTRIAELDLSPTFTTELAPLFAVLAPLNAQIAVADARLAAFVREDPIALRLTTAPVWARDGERVRGDDRRPLAVSHGPRVGGVPRRDSERAQLRGETATRAHYESGQRAHALAAGRPTVEAAWQILRSKSAETEPLRVWALQIAQRRGKRIAVVALARRLAGILYAMWRDDVAYDARRIRPLAPAVYQRAG